MSTRSRTVLSRSDRTGSHALGACLAAAVAGLLALAVAAAVAFVPACVPVAGASPLWSFQQAELTLPNPGAVDLFGESVAVSGDTAVVGAQLGLGGAGAVNVYVRTNGVWARQATLTAADGAAGHEFGMTVAISGGTVVVGAPDHEASGTGGRAYVFTRSGTTWTLQQELAAPDGASGDFFGNSVAVSGDTAVVGAYERAAPGTNDTAGAAYVFVRSGSSWSQQGADLVASDHADFDWFGSSVAVSGDTVIVGAYHQATLAGAAYIFVHNGADWVQKAKLTAPAPAKLDEFGLSVAVSGDTALIGAMGRAVGTLGVRQGAAYVFVRSGSTWSQQSELTADDGALYDYFGQTVALDGDTALVGAPGHAVGSLTSAGAAYVFSRAGGVWTQAPELTMSDAASGDEAGATVALSGATVLIGAPDRAISGNSQAGTAYALVLDGAAPTTTVGGVG